MDTLTRARTTIKTVPVLGHFSLERAARLGFGRRGVETWDGVMRMAFCVDTAPSGPYAATAGVVVRQPASERLTVEVTTDGDPEVVTAQVARILSVDVDSRGFDDLARRDPVVARLHTAAAGLRPPQFHSPYEASAWSVVSARRSAAWATTIRERLSAAYGTAYRLAGQTLHAWPTPHRLREVTEAQAREHGLPARAVPRLKAAADAAVAGQLSAERLRAMDPEAAREDVQSIPGIGPFYSGLIVYRSLGLPDVLPLIEPRSRAALEQASGVERPLSDEAYVALAEAWRPYRMWMTFLARATS